MRKLGVLAAAAGLAVSGSVVKADFVISSNRQVGAVVVASGSTAGTYDLVSFTVTNTGTNGTGTTVNSIDIALYSASGMLIGVGTGAKGGLPTTAADIFASKSANNNSWIADNTSQFNLSTTTGGSVLTFGSNPTTTAGVSATSQTFSNNELVGGIAGVIFASSPTLPQADGAPGVYFAQAVVPTGASVELLNPVASGRAFEPNSGIFSPLSGSFQANNLTTAGGPYVNAVPEPGSLALVGIGAVGLLARRRRTA